MGTFKKTLNELRRTRIKSTGLVSIGLICGFLVSSGWTAMAPPTEHKGLKVEKLGFVPEESMLAQVGLKGDYDQSWRADRQAQCRYNAYCGLR